MKYTRGYLDLISIIMQLQLVVVVLVSCKAAKLLSQFIACK